MSDIPWHGGCVILGAASFEQFSAVPCHESTSQIFPGRRDHSQGALAGDILLCRGFSDPNHHSSASTPEWAQGYFTVRCGDPLAFQHLSAGFPVRMETIPEPQCLLQGCRSSAEPSSPVLSGPLGRVIHSNLDNCKVDASREIIRFWGS